VSRIHPNITHSGNAVVTPELASAQARRAEKEIADGFYRGPLHGIPVAVKDICNTSGVVTAAGMPIHARHVPDFDSTVVKRLADAGAVLLGKLQLTEGALNGIGRDSSSTGDGSPRRRSADRRSTRRFVS
jgi:amidase